ncbi:helix-turn-helix transcriptional regulator [Cohnella nanjingensis]|uniref:AraC family transcriptional regulator n=1 Tax=Cohnella nanjingensis TaxID=1387779 RepID=A0A7X0VIK4_9BACL|nr:AraC family transcriptional regulator [Cohnella nanjingensis]MBB6673749.1 AraC family transcriptional regulator [Cohnella nanjingensis]
MYVIINRDDGPGPVPAVRSATRLPAIHVLGDFVMKPGSGLAERDIPDYELLYFPEGTGTVYRVGEREYTLREPCFIVTRPGEVHSYRYDRHEPTRHLFVHFWLRDFPVAALPLLMPFGPSVIPYAGDFLVSLLKQMLAIAHLHPERLQESGSLLLLSLLAEIHYLPGDGPTSGEAVRLPPQIEKALRIVEQAIPAPLSVETLAGRVGWTPEHLSRSFVRHLGYTPKEAITRRRIELACQLLLHGQKSVKEIAFEVGFADQNYFSRVFKATKAVTATEYRNKHYHPRYADLAAVTGGESLYPPNRVFFGER